MSVSFLGLFVLIAIVFGIVLLLKKSKGNILPVIIVIAVIIFAGYMLTRVDVQNGTIMNNAQVGEYEMEFSPVIWEDIEDQFGADFYSSKAVAAKALASQVVDLLYIVTENKQTPSMIQVCANVDNDTMTTAVLNGFADKLREKTRPYVDPYASFNDYNGQNDELREKNEIKILSDSKIPKSPIQDLDPNAITIKLRVVNSQTRTSPPLQAETNTGQVIAELQGKGGKIERTVNYEEKNWIADTASFVNNNPNFNIYIARSQDSCVSLTEAQLQAEKEAVRYVQKLIDPYIQGEGQYKISPLQLIDYNMIVDQYSQSFKTSSGQVWRSASLIDISNNKINNLIRQNTRVMTTEKGRMTKLVFSGAAFCLVMLVLYFFLDYATKGYYKQAITIFVVVCLLIGLVMIFGLGMFHFDVPTNW